LLLSLGIGLPAPVHQPVESGELMLRQASGKYINHITFIIKNKMRWTIFMKVVIGMWEWFTGSTHEGKILDSCFIFKRLERESLVSSLEKT